MLACVGHCIPEEHASQAARLLSIVPKASLSRCGRGLGLGLGLDLGLGQC